jgi:adenylosuccinate synthase
MEEIRRYGVDTGRLLIDEQATIITHDDIAEEATLVSSIGSTGQGVGYATANNITNRKPSNKNKARDHSKELMGFLGSSHEELEKIFSRHGKVLLEGTQGAGLSLHHGFYPYVTSRDTNVSGCLAEAGIAPGRVRKIVMVVRTLPIRVESPETGWSGPFLSDEISWDRVAERSGIDLEDLLSKEKTTTTDRKRRVAEFSWSLFRKACEINSPTDIALTFADYFSVKNRDARRIEQLTRETIHFVEEVERCAGVRVSLISTRFDYRSVIDRRAWKEG